MPQRVLNILCDERGAYGGVELMFITGIVVTIASAIMAGLNNSTSGLPRSTDTVTAKVQNAISSGS